MTLIIRKIILPDGKKATEIERQYHGGSETQLRFSYRRFGFPMSTKKYKTCCWSGRIEGVKAI